MFLLRFLGEYYVGSNGELGKWEVSTWNENTGNQCSGSRRIFILEYVFVSRFMNEVVKYLERYNNAVTTTSK